MDFPIEILEIGERVIWKYTPKEFRSEDDKEYYGEVIITKRFCDMRNYTISIKQITAQGIAEIDLGKINMMGRNILTDYDEVVGRLVFIDAVRNGSSGYLISHNDYNNIISYQFNDKKINIGRYKNELYVIDLTNNFYINLGKINDEQFAKLSRPALIHKFNSAFDREVIPKPLELSIPMARNYIEV